MPPPVLEFLFMYLNFYSSIFVSHSSAWITLVQQKYRIFFHISVIHLIRCHWPSTSSRWQCISKHQWKDEFYYLFAWNKRYIYDGLVKNNRNNLFVLLDEKQNCLVRKKSKIEQSELLPCLKNRVFHSKFLLLLVIFEYFLLISDVSKSTKTTFTRWHKAKMAFA